MKYLINYVTGACQWAGQVDLASMASMIGAGVVVSVIDIDAKKALISNDNSEGQRNIGWADIPQYADIDPSQLSILEDSSKKSEESLEKSE